MKTMFSLGFAQESFGSRLVPPPVAMRPRYGLGQPAAGTLSDSDREALMNLLDAAIRRHNEIKGFAQRSDIATIMGPNKAEFLATVSAADNLIPEMQSIYTRLQGGSGENSYWTDSEVTDYGMFQQSLKKEEAMALAAENATPAGRTGSGAAPVGPAVKPPGAKVPAGAVAPTTPPSSSSTPLIIGGIAAGALILAVALS